MPDTDGGRPLRIMVIIGSNHPGSRTRAAARYAAGCVADAGHQAYALDPERQELPIADPVYHDDPLKNPDKRARALVIAARQADGFVLASPLYHNSFSGVIKNALDHLTIDEFYHKPVGLIVHGSNLTAVQACDQLRIVTRGLYGIAVPEQAVTVPEDFTLTDDQWVLTDPAKQERIRSIVASVLKLARR
jgi:NAD(P)H-dependent FMN reductase